MVRIVSIISSDLMLAHFLFLGLRKPFMGLQQQLVSSLRSRFTASSDLWQDPIIYLYFRFLLFLQNSPLELRDHQKFISFY